MKPIQFSAQKKEYMRAWKLRNKEYVTKYNRNYMRVKDSGLYNLFRSIQTRIYKKYASNYERYGGRGIKCEWKTYEEFRDDMLKGYLEHKKIYGSDTEIDRIDSNGHYSKDNCRWVTRKENSRNRRNVRLITLGDKEFYLDEISKIYGIKYATLYNRYVKRGLSGMELIKPVK